MVFIYLFYDLYWVGLISSLSVFVSFLMITYYKSQFFFLICLPYLCATGTTTFLFTSILSTFYSYFLLFYVLCLIVYPIFLLFSCLLICVPILPKFVCFRLFKRIILRSFFYLFLIVFLVQIIPWVVVALILAVQTLNYQVMYFVFDFSVESWLYFFLFLVFFMILVLLFSTLFIQLIWSSTFRKFAFWYRLSVLFILICFLTIFVPADPFLHFFLFVIFVLVSEGVLLTRFLHIGYVGRVA
jgi:hypothetical protein